MAPIVIVGSGMAAYAVAREFRKQDTSTPLMLVTLDDGASYSKPMLSTGFTKQKTADQLMMASAAQMSEQLDISIRTYTRVTAIDTDKHLVLIDEQPVEYSKLVLATGAEVFRLPGVDYDSDRIFSINDLEDYRAFRSKAVDAKRILIIGTGLIGCEYANDLINGGYQVELVGLADQVIDGLLPPESGECVGKALQAAGAVLHLQRKVETVAVESDGVVVTLDDGNTLHGDVLISAIGLTPNTSLAKDAGLETRKGIVTNRQLQTSNADIYALGDCAEVDGHVLLYVLPLMACARALASTLAGQPQDVSYGVMPVMIKTPVCPVVVAPPHQPAGPWQVESDGFSSKALCYAEDGTLVGFALTGDATKEKQALSKQISGIHSS